MTSNFTLYFLSNSLRRGRWYLNAGILGMFWVFSSWMNSATPENNVQSVDHLFLTTTTNCFPVQIDQVSVRNQSVCGQADAGLTIHFTDENTNQSSYRVELTRNGFTNPLVFKGYQSSPIVINQLYPDEFTIEVIRELDDCGSEAVTYTATSACESLDFRSPTEVCGTTGKVTYTNCENFTVHIPLNLIESNTFFYADDDHIGCLAFVNENCEIQPSTRVYCADLEKPVPVWTFTFEDDDPFDGIPTVLSLVTYTKEDIGLEDIYAARISHIMCNSGDASGAEINDAIWGVLPLPPGLQPIACNPLCQASKDAVPDNAVVDGAAQTIVTYKAPNPNFQDFVEQIADDSCRCFPVGITCQISVNNGELQDTCGVTVCAGDNITLSPTAEGVTEWFWVGPNGFRRDNQREITLQDIDVEDAGEYVVAYIKDDTCTTEKAFTINVNSNPAIQVIKTDATCGEINGSITVTFEDDPQQDSLLISLDGGMNFQDPVLDNTGQVTFDGLQPGIYGVVATWIDGSCQVDAGDFEIVAIDAPTVTLPDNVFLCEPWVDSSRSSY